ncbi:hypothetical protein EDC56_3425 [Sinobacterium caligoides]|uniref:Uncharacterized protein n=1 Tax=Sinobacterium caligoides TaxID=933926 RepID=A0A3N2DG24_9GAMM|nr:hypothetical protein [Sinobacterium caligoides]ROR98689.1 hypothetical protein EDC56_3425 [Sinobacterium caligoides]
MSYFLYAVSLIGCAILISAIRRPQRLGFRNRKLLAGLALLFGLIAPYCLLLD